MCVFLKHRLESRILSLGAFLILASLHRLVTQFDKKQMFAEPDRFAWIIQTVDLFVDILNVSRRFKIDARPEWLGRGNALESVV